MGEDREVCAGGNGVNSVCIACSNMLYTLTNIGLTALRLIIFLSCLLYCNGNIYTSKVHNTSDMVIYLITFLH